MADFAVDPGQTVEAMWKWAVDNIHHAAESIMGKTKPARKLIDKQTWWWNEEVQRAIREKKKGFQDVEEHSD